MNRWKNIFSDREFWFILVFNLCLVWGYEDGWLSMDTIIWIYFFQSVIIGMSNTVRMACLKDFNSDNFQINGEAVQPTNKTKWMSAIFFTLHYGFFHLAYFIFLIIFSVGNGSKLDFRMVLINAGIIALNAIISTSSNIMQDREDKPAISSMFFTPYLRVVPMHIFIILGFTRKVNPEVLIPVLGAINSFYVFLILKLFSDLVMHIVIQKTWRGPRLKPVGGYI